MLDGQKIRRLRLAKGMSLRELATLTGGAVSYAHISEIENGLANNPTKKTTQALAKALGINEQELFTEDAPNGISHATQGELPKVEPPTK